MSTVTTAKRPLSDLGDRNEAPLRLVGMSPSLLTADQVAQMLGVPKTWVYEQSRKGRIPTVTLGRYRRYRRRGDRQQGRAARGGSWYVDGRRLKCKLGLKRPAGCERD